MHWNSIRHEMFILNERLKELEKRLPKPAKIIGCHRSKHNTDNPPLDFRLCAESSV